MLETQVEERGDNEPSSEERRVRIDRLRSNELVINELAKLDLELNQAGSMAMSRVPGDDEIYISG